MEVSFLDFTPALAKDIAKIEAACFSSPWSEQAILDSFNNSTFFAVVKTDNQIIGYGGVQTVLDEGYITNIAVLENYRKSGVGKKIMSRLIEYANDKNLSFLSLEVRVSNTPAIKLYKSFGFLEAGIRRNFYTLPKEDAIILTKRFDL